MINETGHTFKNVSIFVKTLTTMSHEQNFELDIKPYDGYEQEFFITLAVPKHMRNPNGRYYVSKVYVKYDDIIYSEDPQKWANELFDMMTHEILRYTGGLY